MKKEKYIHFRVTEAEYNKILEKANVTNKSLSKYVRDKCLGKKDIIVEGLSEFTKELNKIGVNINQIARSLNTFGLISEADLNINNINSNLVKIWQQLNSLTRKRI